MSTRQSKTKSFYNPKEVADILGVNKRTLFRWEKVGQIPKARRDMNNRRIYTREDILNLMEITGRKIEDWRG